MFLVVVGDVFDCLLSCSGVGLCTFLFFFLEVFAFVCVALFCKTTAVIFFEIARVVFSSHMMLWKAGRGMTLAFQARGGLNNNENNIAANNL